MVEKRKVDMVIRQRGKRNLAKVERWATDALERIGAKCSLISNAKSASDWALFLNCIYEAVTTLTTLQRTILLLSQEFGIPRREVARIVGMDPSLVHAQYNRAVDKVVEFVKSRNLMKPLSVVGEEITPVVLRKYGGNHVPNSQKNSRAIECDADEINELWQSARSEIVQTVSKKPRTWRRSYIYLTRRIVEEKQRS